MPFIARRTHRIPLIDLYFFLPFSKRVLPPGYKEEVTVTRLIYVDTAVTVGNAEQEVLHIGQDSVSFIHSERRPKGDPEVDGYFPKLNGQLYLDTVDIFDRNHRIIELSYEPTLPPQAKK